LPETQTENRDAVEMWDPQFAEDCPVQRVIDQLADKWKLKILLTLSFSGVVRFRELQRQIGASPKVLTSALRDLENDGLITRTHYAEIPPRVEYRPSERSRSLLPILARLQNWAVEHAPSSP
jgi:DNA-binding HxlR family transcriptional regulator